MKINVWAEKHITSTNENTFYYEKVFSELIDGWISSYPDIFFEKKCFLPSSELNKIKEYSIEDRKFIHNGSHSVFYFIIENEDTKKYYLITYWDYLQNTNHEFLTRYDYSNLIEIFSAQGDYDHYSGLSLEQSNVKFTPLNKLVWKEGHYKEIEAIMSSENQHYKTRVIPNKLRFRVGDHYGLRSYLVSDSRFDGVSGIRISDADHTRELSETWINMDIYSVSGVSMRLIEGFGLGTAVLSPVFPQRCHSPIIPDYHYVKVEFDEHNLNPSNYKKLADSYIETFEKLKKDPDRMHYIAENARKYYLENCTSANYINTLNKLIDFYKLS
jgi:hypothetical protein